MVLTMKAHMSFSRYCCHGKLCKNIKQTAFYSTTTDKVKNKANEMFDQISGNFSAAYEKYEQFVGLTDVQDAQMKVKKAENKFLEERNCERETMREMSAVRDELKHVRERLSHVTYSNPLYPQLANEQHELVNKEEKLKTEFDRSVERERNAFLDLSAAMRDSYEKERARVERTKNWSLIGSVIGSIIGMLGASYINRTRTNELKTMVQEQSSNKDIQNSIDRIVPAVDERYANVQEELVSLQACLVNKLIGSVDAAPPPLRETAVRSEHSGNLHHANNRDSFASSLATARTEEALARVEKQVVDLHADTSVAHDALLAHNAQFYQLAVDLERAVGAAAARDRQSAADATLRLDAIVAKLDALSARLDDVVAARSDSEETEVAEAEVGEVEVAEAEVAEAEVAEAEVAEAEVAEAEVAEADAGSGGRGRALKAGAVWAGAIVLLYYVISF